MNYRIIEVLSFPNPVLCLAALITSFSVDRYFEVSRGLKLYLTQFFVCLPSGGAPLFGRALGLGGLVCVAVGRLALGVAPWRWAFRRRVVALVRAKLGFRCWTVATCWLKPLHFCS